VKQLLAMVLFAMLSTVVHAQVTCQTYGNTTNCNGSLGPAIAPMPFINFGAQQAQQAQAQANANLQDQQAALAQQQAQLARAQAETIRQQTYALQQQQQIEEQRQHQQQLDEAPRQQAARSAAASDAGAQRPAENQALQDKYDRCVQLLSAPECTDLKQELDSAGGQAQLPPTHEQAAATGGAVPTDKLKAEAATFEAIMRSAPPGSKAFRDAVKSLQATNEELAKRGALK